MIRRLIRATSAGSLAVLLAAGVALAGNPAGTGQPFVECGEGGVTAMPNGFTTDGFANAEEHYAGHGASVNSGNWHAVSQYDVACYQLTIHAH